VMRSSMTHDISFMSWYERFPSRSYNAALIPISPCAAASSYRCPVYHPARKVAFCFEVLLAVKTQVIFNSGGSDFGLFKAGISHRLTYLCRLVGIPVLQIFFVSALRVRKT
jgi:hypothetical protein